MKAEGKSIIKIKHNTEKTLGDLLLLKFKRKTAIPWVKNSQMNNDKEYKARHDWVGKVIHWEMCKKFQFDHTNPAPVLENDTHKLLWDFNIQTDHLIPTRRPDLIIINNKNKRIFAKLSTFLSLQTSE